MIDGMRLNYVIATWAGGRRVMDPRCSCPGAYYLIRHFESLARQLHKLDQITVMVPECDGCPQEFWNVIDKLPKKVRDAKVVICCRENLGYSYGSWSKAYDYWRTEFNYYFFMEDDYQYCQENFDRKMIELFKSLPECGYLAGQCWDIPGIYPYHAGMSCGLAKGSLLERAFHLHGYLPYDSRAATYVQGENSQVIFSRGVSIDIGKNLFDVRSRYRIAFRQPSFRIDFHHGGHEKLAILDVI